VIVRVLDIERTIAVPAETDAELIIDPDRMLSRSNFPQHPETIARPNAKLLETGGDFELPEFPPRYRLETCEASDPCSSRQGFRIRILEGGDHAIITMYCIIDINR
jgi:hypothetical protein